MSKTFNPRNAVFTPAETATLGVEWVQEREVNKHRAMPLPIPQIDEYFAPLMPSEICAILAQTHNYKSGFIDMWENALAKYLKDNGREDEVIFHIDTETAIQGLAIQAISQNGHHSTYDLQMGNVNDWRDVIQAAGKIADIDIYRVASKLGSENNPDLYLSNIYRAIQFAVNGDLLGRPLKPACIFLDYLQALPYDPDVKRVADLEARRRLQVREDVYRIRQMGDYFSCPVVVGVQAKQAMAGHGGTNMLIPGMYDGEESSSIAQRFDRQIALWMPKTSHSVGEVLTHKGLSFRVEENLIWVKVLKQRGRLPSGKAWRCYIRFSDNTIAPAQE